ncbi:MAG: ectonucleotide pyrophosphatase/phosphodiesterase [Defluviitaleaceae bacterium]|nr:ectonucleotide pyrophosphatase/phosphodiesterase [Defluviitaleaceae bacterium]
MALLVVSFDALGDKVFEEMAMNEKKYPNIAKFKKNIFYRNSVKTIFVSNTYPIHTTVSTGKLPKDHGITSNFLKNSRNVKEKEWAQYSKLIKTKTIWKAAREKGLKTASFLWPVTCGAKIDYHIPEVHLLKGQNRLVENLKYGSKFFQINSLLKYKKYLKNSEGIEGQPSLDNFTVASASNLFKKKKIDLVLVHLIAYDHFCHKVGPDGDLEIAKKSLDRNLGKLIKFWHGDILVFSDHSQLQVHENIDLDLLYPNNFLQMGGCAFGKKISLDMPEQYWFGRYLTKKEIEDSGYYGEFTFGIAAKHGFNFSDKQMKGDHGYPIDYDNYNVFYGINKKLDYSHKLKKDIRDVTAIISKELNLKMDILKDYQI